MVLGFTTEPFDIPTTHNSISIPLILGETPPKTNEYPVKNDGWKMIFLLKSLLFRGHSFISDGANSFFCVGDFQTG